MGGKRRTKKASKKSAKRQPARLQSVQLQSVQQQPSNVIKTGFDHGYIVDQLLGLTRVEGILHFIVKWKNIEEEELVEASIVNEKIPQTVIALYEKRSFWDEDLLPINHD